MDSEPRCRMPRCTRHLTNAIKNQVAQFHASGELELSIQQATMSDPLGVTYFDELDLLFGFWHVPLAPGAQKCFMVGATPSWFSSIDPGSAGSNLYHHLFQGVMCQP